MRQETTTNATQYITITPGNLRNNHVYIASGDNFFPKDSIGSSSVRTGTGTPGRPVTVELVGLDRRIVTDIPSDARTGKPRRQFRNRSWAHDFFRRHQIVVGDVLRLERVGTRNYRLTVAHKTRNETGLTFLEFFAGIGLMRLGLEKAGWKIAYANDIDQTKHEMYAAHFGKADSHFELGDIHEIDVSNIPTATLATASFPCTDLSLAGGRVGLNGRHSSAFFGFLNVLQQMGYRRPPLILLENVTGFLTSHRGNDFHVAMKSLNELGYSVDPFVIDAKWFVPQSRPRLFVVAFSQELSSHESRSVLVPPSRLRPPLLAQFIASHPDISWKLRLLPDPPYKSVQTLRDVLEDLPDSAPEWWNPDRAEYLYNQMSPRHRAIADAWIHKRKWSYGTVFRRVRRQPDGHKRSMAELRSDGLAGCLRTPKGGSGRQILFKAGYGRYSARLLTPRECARLMGADDFVIYAPLNQALFGFGDAVCVSAISWIADNYLNQLVRSTSSKQT